jgi:hypothetical protein
VEPHEPQTLVCFQCSGPKLPPITFRLARLALLRSVERQGLAFPLRSPVPSPHAPDAILLSDKRVPTIGIFCALCQRRETFDVGSLKLQYGGDVKMPDLLALLVADCPKRQRRVFSVYDRCRVTYDRASRFSP